MRRGTTLPEVLIVTGILGLLVALAGPAVQSSREMARAISCRNNLRQLVVAASAYESAYGMLPYTSTTWIGPTSTGEIVPHVPISPHRSLMCFIDSAVASHINFEDPTSPVWSTSGPPSFVTAGMQSLQQTSFPFLLCPSDAGPTGATHYRANLGISVNILPPSLTIEAFSQSGAFVNGRAVAAREFVDGLSNTALFSERVVGDYAPGLYHPFRDIFADGTVIYDTPTFVEHCRNDAVLAPAQDFSFSGGTWLLGGFLNTWYLHVLAPNSTIPDCSTGITHVDGGPGVISARSMHPGGVNVAVADGSVRFVTDGIDVVVWQALGTRNGADGPSNDW